MQYMNVIEKRLCTPNAAVVLKVSISKKKLHHSYSI